MPVSNRMIYIDTSTDPDLGVSIADIQSLVPVTIKRTVSGVTERRNSSDLGTLAGSSVGDTIRDNAGGQSWTVASRVEINKWARYKPQRSDRLKYLPHGTMLAQTGTRKGGNFGLSIPFCNGVMNELVHDLITPSSGVKGWEHLKPRGDRTAQGQGQEWYRKADFVRLPSTIDDTDDTPSALTGYNHLAPIPFNVEINADLTNEEVNKEEISNLEITFRNSLGNDLHLQDFVNVASGETTGYAWRPVIQVFNDYKPETKDWWKQYKPVVEVAGQAITGTAGSTFKVSLNIQDTNKFPFQSGSDRSIYKYYLCIGVGYCTPSNPSNPSLPPTDQNASLVFHDATNNLFVIPYNQEDVDNGVYPFLYSFWVTKHEERKINVTELWYWDDGRVTWRQATRSGTNFTVGANAGELIRIIMTIDKRENVDTAYFVPQHPSSEAHTPYFRVQARESLNGGAETTYWLTPKSRVSDQNWTNVTEIAIPPKVSGEAATVTAYAECYTSISRGQLKTYHMYSATGDSEYVHNGQFTIQRE